MNKFKIGDLLVGTKTSPYGITNQWTIVKVLGIDGETGRLYVKIVKLHPTTPDDIKRKYESNRWMRFEDWVSPDYFELYKNAEYYYNPELNKFGYWDNGEGLIRV